VIAFFLLSLAFFLVLSIPVAFALGLSSVTMLIFLGETDFFIVPQNILKGADNFSLMAIPFFILAGELMNEGGLSLGIVRFVQTLLGHIKGGLGYVAIVASMIFAGISGAAVADTSAIGSVLLPIMKKEGYDVNKSTAIVCAAGTIGPIIPPSIPMVVFGVVGGVSITKMFLGGIIPGIITGLLLFISWRVVTAKDEFVTYERASRQEIRAAFIEAIPSLTLPIIILGGILSGIFTPTEAGVVAAVYALVLAMFVYRRINFGQMRHIFIRSAISTSVVMLVVATATAVAYVVTIAQVPKQLGDLVMSATQNKYVILLIINLLVLAVGCVMDVSPSIMILGPILLPITAKLGIDPVFFGVVLVYGLCIGLLTPPVGNVLYVGCGLSKIDFVVLVRHVAPHLIIYVVVLFLITYVPELIMFIPNLM
jgi:tripartite ATP-independent transporter DctM subunit